MEQKIRISLICVLVTEGGMHKALLSYGVQRLLKSKLRGAVGKYYEEVWGIRNSKSWYKIADVAGVRFECFDKIFHEVGEIVWEQIGGAISLRNCKKILYRSEKSRVHEGFYNIRWLLVLGSTRRTLWRKSQWIRF